MQGYDELIKLNKPFALGELGPDTLNGRFHFSLW
jgi:beta-mannanase